MVCVSKDDRTTFRISIRDGKAGTVMIASDEITISTQRADITSTLQETSVRINTAGQLYIDNQGGSDGVVTMKFGDLRDQICVLRNEGTVRFLAGGGCTPWELTD